MLVVGGSDVGPVMEWQSVSSSEGNHIAASIACVLESSLDTIKLLGPCLQMLY